MKFADQRKMLSDKFGAWAKKHQRPFGFHVARQTLHKDERQRNNKHIECFMRRKKYAIALHLALTYIRVHICKCECIAVRVCVCVCAPCLSAWFKFAWHGMT